MKNWGIFVVSRLGGVGSRDARNYNAAGRDASLLAEHSDCNGSSKGYRVQGSA